MYLGIEKSQRKHITNIFPQFGGDVIGLLKSRMWGSVKKCLC